jgi:hypothetical protein
LPVREPGAEGEGEGKRGETGERERGERGKIFSLPSSFLLPSSFFLLPSSFFLPSSASASKAKPL